MISKTFQKVFLSRNIQRTYFRGLRKKLTLREKIFFSYKISNIVLCSKIFYFCKNIAIFLPFDGEIDTNILVSELWKLKYNIFLPVVYSYHKKILLFSKYCPNTCFVSNRYNILEPISNSEDYLSCCNMDIIFFPLVAFDRLGYRLGMGGGFYDNILHNWRSKNFLPIGLAYDFQLANKIIPAPWETFLPAIFTPTKFWIWK
ncbi:MAG: 5-formyltetrahydrofolate cyclo-ligase [Buchnera aphidicola (Nurudea shiraii)]